MLTVTTVVFVATMVFVFLALARGARRARDGSPRSSERTLTRWVSGATTITVAILIGLLIASVSTGRSIGSVQASNAVTIEVIGHQWWWEVIYDDAVPSQRVQTANEIHIPTHRPVVLKVTSRDVIHSFWAPNLHGKRDLIPGYTTAIWLDADQPGIFRGQCAEFCGLQHAHMAFDVVAEPQADFDLWLEGMRQPARPPQSDAERHGRDVFMNNRCGTCHTVQGTGAHGQVAPDLTHIGSRSTIGAGTLPNTREHRQAWVRDPQASKSLEQQAPPADPNLAAGSTPGGTGP